MSQYNDFQSFITEYTKNRTVSPHEFVDLNTLISFTYEKRKETQTINTDKRKKTYLGYGEETRELKEYVYTLGFTETILNIYTSSIKNLLSNRELLLISDKVDNNKDLKNKIDEINSEFKQYDLLKYILDNFKQYVYWGNIIFIIHNNTLRELPPPQNLDNLSLTLYDKKFKTNHDKKNYVTVSINNNLKNIPYENCFILQNDPLVSEIEIDEETLITVKKTITGQSILKGSLYDIFIYYAKKKMNNMYSFKEVLRPDIMINNFTENVRDEDRINTVQKIENVLNDRESSSILSGSPLQIMSILENKIVNQVKVLPNIRGVSNQEKLQNESIREKLQILEEAKDKDKLDILNNLQIPEELFNGNGNQYEIESRSSNYKDKLSLILFNLDSSIVNWVKNKYPDVDFGKLTTSINPAYLGIFNNLNTTITETISSLENVKNMIDKVSDIVKSENYDKDKLKQIVHNLLSKVDPSLVPIVEAYIGEQENTESEENRMEEF